MSVNSLGVQRHDIDVAYRDDFARIAAGLLRQGGTRRMSAAISASPIEPLPLRVRLGIGICSARGSALDLEPIHYREDHGVVGIHWRRKNRDLLGTLAITPDQPVG